MEITLIICTWNNATRLDITLDVLSKCRTTGDPQWELILVNNNCTDKTDLVVSKYQGLIPIRYIKEPEQGLSNARNAGLKVAQGDLILFTDDDVKPVKGWIETYWKAYETMPQGYYFGGPVESEFESETVNEELIQFAPLSVKGLDWGKRQKVLDSNETLLSANWACPSYALKRVGGFDPRFGLDASSKSLYVGEESDLMARLQKKGMKGVYLPDAKIRHYVPEEKTTLQHISQKSKAYGYYLGVREYPTYRNDKKVFGFPKWMVKKTAVVFGKWMVAVARGEKGFKEYLLFKQMLGQISGVQYANRHHVDIEPPLK